MDVNVWLALSAPDHFHHARARRYWDIESGEGFAVCRLTSLSILRHWTNARIMGHALLSSHEAWSELERWLDLPEVVYLEEPNGLHEVFGSFAATLTLGQASWTDAFLAAFCIAQGCRLVSFDGGFNRYAGLDLLELKA